MRTLYLRKEEHNRIRKVLLDMAFLVSNKKIRFPKYLYEEGLYLPFTPEPGIDKTEKYELSKDKIKKEDDNFYYFEFPFKPEQVEDTAY